MSFFDAFQPGATVSSNGSRGERHTYPPTFDTTGHDVWKDIVQLVRAVCLSHLASFRSSWLFTQVTQRHYDAQLDSGSNDALYLQRTSLILVVTLVASRVLRDFFVVCYVTGLPRSPPTAVKPLIKYDCRNGL